MGRSDRAFEKLELSLKIHKEMDLWGQIRRGLAGQGILALQAGRPDQAAKIAVELKNFVAQSLNRKAVRYVQLLEGNIELNRGNFVPAIEFFEQAVSRIYLFRIFKIASFLLFGLNQCNSMKYPAGSRATKARTRPPSSSLLSGALIGTPCFFISSSQLSR